MPKAGICGNGLDARPLVLLENYDGGLPPKSPDVQCRVLLESLERVKGNRLEQTSYRSEAWRHFSRGQRARAYSTPTPGNNARCFAPLPCPPYTLELAPLDFHLFPEIKEGLKGKHFPIDDAVIAAVDE